MLGGLGALPNPVQAARMQRALRKVPLQAADVDMAGAPVAFWRDFTEHAAPDDTFWAEADHDGADLARLPPVSMVTGWWDLFLPAQLRDYAAIRKAGVHRADHHRAVDTRRSRRGEDGHPAGRRPGWTTSCAAARRRRARRYGYSCSSRHLARLRGVAARCRPGDAYYLRPRRPGPGGRAGDAAPDRFVYDPADPTPTVGGPLLSPPGKQADNGPVEARADVLTYTTDPLPADLDLAGPVSARVFVRTGRAVRRRVRAGV